MSTHARLVKRSVITTVFAAALTASSVFPAMAQAPAEGSTPASSESAQAAAACSFATRGDNVHISSDGSNDASGHGWWDNINCNASTATVTVQLQQYVNGAWRNVGTKGEEVLFAGGGRGNRTTGRAHCNYANTTSWRSVVDVDISGLIDPDNVYITNSQSLRCRY